MTFKLHPQTQIGAVSLKIREMERSLRFYVDVLGFQIHDQEDNIASLGVGGDDLLILNEYPDAPPIEAHAGLYHFAILVPSRLDLAKSLHQLIQTQTRLGGFADHVVSEAIYLADPDGIGIEIYRDRPKDTWQFKNGEIVIDTLALDVQNVLDELSATDIQWNGLPQGTRIGHVHLNTGRNTEASKRFYVDQLGFDVMMSMGGYWHFIAAGGYHHHLGLRPAETRQNQASIGLDWYAIDLPNNDSLAATVDHLDTLGMTLAEVENDYELYDHANNKIRLRSAS